MATDRTRIFDVTRRGEHEKYLYRCFAPMPFRKHNNRQQYLMKAIPKGFHKKLLVFGEESVGQIEYAPAEVSGYPITGDNMIVMNCIWVLSRTKGRGLGRLLVQDMVKSEKLAAGFATVALENYWSPWFRRSQTQKLGFRPVYSIKVTHKTKHKEQVFSTYLTWMPKTENAEPPAWDRQKLLEGETFCLAHPLYQPQAWKGNVFDLK